MITNRMKTYVLSDHTIDVIILLRQFDRHFMYCRLKIDYIMCCVT